MRLDLHLADLSGINGIGILIITALVVAAATIFPKHFEKIKGADKIGTMLMQVFFAAIGASANIMVVIKVGPILFLFAGIDFIDSFNFYSCCWKNI